MHPAILGLLAGGGALALSGEKKPDPPAGTEPPARPIASSLVIRKAAPGTARDPLVSGRTTTGSGSSVGSGSGSGLPADVEAEVKRRLEAELDGMTEEARAAACKRLKAEFPDDQGIQNMPCDADLDTVLHLVGAAGGAAVGGAIGGPLGAVVGAYLGDKAGGWVSEQLSDVWSAPSDHTTSSLDLSTVDKRAAACRATDAKGKADIVALCKSRNLPIPGDCY